MRARVSSNASNVISKQPKPEGGTNEGRDASLDKHTTLTPKIRKKLASQHNSKGRAAYVPSPSYFSPNSFSCCQSPSTVRKRLCCCDNSMRELLWHSKHMERGKYRDSKLPLRTSIMSWHKRSIDKWQLNATHQTSTPVYSANFGVGEGPPLCSSHKRPSSLGAARPRNGLTRQARDRNPCGPLRGPPPTSKPENQTRGLDMLQPMVDRRQSQWLYSAHRQRSPQSTSACELLVHVRSVLPAQSTVAIEPLPTTEQHNKVGITMTRPPFTVNGTIIMMHRFLLFVKLYTLSIWSPTRCKKISDTSHQSTS